MPGTSFQQRRNLDRVQVALCPQQIMSTEAGLLKEKGSYVMHGFVVIVLTDSLTQRYVQTGHFIFA